MLKKREYLTGFQMQVSGSGKKPESRKASSRDSLFESCPVIDADFVEVDEDFFRDPDSSSELNSEAN